PVCQEQLTNLGSVVPPWVLEQSKLSCQCPRCSFNSVRPNWMQSLQNLGFPVRVPDSLGKTDHGSTVQVEKADKNSQVPIAPLAERGKVAFLQGIDRQPT